MVPPAPPTLSMMMGWPSACRMGSATMRASVSVGPPGGYDTTMVMGRDG
jgi:hypothetical protein